MKNHSENYPTEEKNNMHVNRKNIGNFWPIPRTGTKYLAVSTHNQTSSIPLIVIMRDILHLVQTKKELKKLLSEKQVMVNHNIIRETNYGVSLFDSINIPLIKKNYTASLNEHKKMIFNETSEKSCEKRVFKVIGKKKLAGNTMQINLLSGRNARTKEDVSVDDSILYNTKTNTVEKIIKMSASKKAYVIKGKHIGTSGTIESIIEQGGKKLVIIKTHGQTPISVWIKNVIVMEEIKHETKH